MLPYLRTALIYSAIWWVMVLLAGAFFAPEWPFDELHFSRYDANHYQWIVSKGYNSVNVAFFPLFPLLWKLVGVGKIVISVGNGLLYLGCAAWLGKEFRLKQLDFALTLSIPMLIFFWLPYSESVFFMASAVLMVGMHRDKLPMILLGLFLASVSRPAYVVLVPALLLTDITWKGLGKETIRRAALFAGVVAVGLLLVAWIQWMDRGVWFEFFSVQSKWDNSLRIPSLPFHTWGSRLILYLDGPALLVGVLSGIALLRIWIRKWKQQVQPPSAGILLALLYLVGISLLVLIYRGGSLFSLNRFVFCTAFFAVPFGAFLRQEWAFRWRYIWIGFLSLMAFWMLFGAYVHIQSLLWFSLLSVLLLIPILFFHPSIQVKTASKWVWIVLMGGMQVFLYHWWLWKEWVA